MPFKAIYENLEAIPEHMREDYRQRADGKWELKPEAAEGVAEYLNPALAANKNKVTEQLNTARQAKTDAENRAKAAEDQLAVINNGGGTVLSKEDKATWDGFLKLGDLPTVTKLVTDGKAAIEQVQKSENEKAFASVAQGGDLKLNKEVLNSWLNGERGKNLKPFLKEVEVTDANGNKGKAKIPYLKKITQNGNTTTETEVSLLDEAKTALFAFEFAALTVVPDNQNGNSNENNGQGTTNDYNPFGAFQLPNQTNTGNQQNAGSGGDQNQTNGGLRLPNLGGGGGNNNQGGNGGNKTRAEQFNAERDKSGRQNPFAPPPQK